MNKQTLRRALRVAVAALVLPGATPAPALAAGPADPFGAPLLPLAATPGAPDPDQASAAAQAANSGAAAIGLSGIRTGRAPAALIDGQWVAPGQSVGKLQLVAVMRDAVRVRHADGRVDTLSLSAGVRLQPPAERRAAPTPAGSTR